jgi:hypothetical protein
MESTASSCEKLFLFVELGLRIVDEEERGKLRQKKNSFKFQDNKQAGFRHTPE